MNKTIMQILLIIANFLFEKVFNNIDTNKDGAISQEEAWKKMDKISKKAVDKIKKLKKKK